MNSQKKEAGDNSIAEIKMDEVIFSELAEFFKVLGDRTRVKILFLLLKKGLYVNEISRALGISQSAISHQLRILKQARLVKYKRNGKEVLYNLDDEHVKDVFEKAFEHVKEALKISNEKLSED